MSRQAKVERFNATSDFRGPAEEINAIRGGVASASRRCHVDRRRGQRPPHAWDFCRDAQSLAAPPADRQGAGVSTSHRSASAGCSGRPGFHGRHQALKLADGCGGGKEGGEARVQRSDYLTIWEGGKGVPGSGGGGGEEGPVPRRAERKGRGKGFGVVFRVGVLAVPRPSSVRPRAEEPEGRGAAGLRFVGSSLGKRKRS